jgi:hypothetical protein
MQSALDTVMATSMEWDPILETAPRMLWAMATQLEVVMGTLTLSSMMRVPVQAELAQALVEVTVSELPLVVETSPSLAGVVVTQMEMVEALLEALDKLMMPNRSIDRSIQIKSNQVECQKVVHTHYYYCLSKSDVCVNVFQWAKDTFTYSSLLNKSSLLQPFRFSFYGVLYTMGIPAAVKWAVSCSLPKPTGLGV